MEACKVDFVRDEEEIRVSSGYWEGNKVRLRAITENDLDEFLDLTSDIDSQRLGNQIEFPIHPETFRKHIENSRTMGNDRVYLGIQSENKLAGSITVFEANRRHGNFSYGLLVFKEMRRKGYASEAITLILRYYFRELGYHRATARVYAFNQPSIALHQHLGFTEEGRIRDAVLTDGTFHDELVFGMLASEFDILDKTLPDVHLTK